MAILPYVKEYTDDCGRRRRYFRRKGFKGGALPGPVGSPEFMEAYQAFQGGRPAPAVKGEARPGTFGHLIASYYQTTAFSNLKPSSKQLYRYALEPLKEKHGHQPLATVTRANMIAIIEKIGARAPGMANLTRAVLQKMLKGAFDRNQIAENPLARKVDTYKVGTHHTWTDAELLQFEARWPLGTRQRLAYALLFYTDQRSGDVVRMSRADIRAGRIKVVQEKTGAELEIDIHPDLRIAIKAYSAKGLSLIGDDRGRPIKRPAFSHMMRSAISEAGLPAKCKPHGLRKAALRVMSENGATGKQMMAVSGHKTTKELDRYTAAADQPTLARSAISLIPIRK